jgi:hypothetical protein
LGLARPPHRCHLGCHRRHRGRAPMEVVASPGLKSNERHLDGGGGGRLSPKGDRRLGTLGLGGSVAEGSAGRPRCTPTADARRENMAWAARRLLIATKSQNELRDPDPGVSVVVGPGKGCCELGGDVVLVVDVVLRWGAVVVVEVEGTADSGRWLRAQGPLRPENGRVRSPYRGCRATCTRPAEMSLRSDRA